ncbi:hypothetical protein JDS87_02795 [Bacillus cereus]|nr:hypothetical protein [Bacillus cereus]
MIQLGYKKMKILKENHPFEQSFFKWMVFIFEKNNYFIKKFFDPHKIVYSFEYV